MLDVRCATLGSSSNMRIRVEVRSALREMFQMICTEHLLVLEGRLMMCDAGIIPNAWIWVRWMESQCREPSRWGVSAVHAFDRTCYLR